MQARLHAGQVSQRSRVARQNAAVVDPLFCGLNLGKEHDSRGESATRDVFESFGGGVGAKVFPLGRETNIQTSQEAGFDEFPEVPASFVEGEWAWACADRWKMKESMPVLEARAALWGLKHLLRSKSSHGKHLVLLVDAMAVALLYTKGRSSHTHVNRLCRQWASNCLVGEVYPHMRWIPSEVNPADEPSRVHDKRRRSRVLINEEVPLSKSSPSDAVSAMCLGVVSCLAVEPPKLRGGDLGCGAQR